jgi:hypothetical protein
MNFSELLGKLGIENGKFGNPNMTLATGTFGKNIDAIIEYCYDNAPIVISAPEITATDEAKGTLQVQGTAAYSGVKNLAAHASFTIDAQGEPQLLIRYILIDGPPKTNSWNFSQSFPQLPTVVDDSQATEFDRGTNTVKQSRFAPLTQLWLSDASYVVASRPQQDPVLDVPLEWGLNFVSHIKPEGFLGMIENVFKNTRQLTIYGTIRKPVSPETVSQLSSRFPTGLERFLYPWDVAADFDKGLPGIFLKVDLNLDYSILKDKIEFTAEQLLMYTPCAEGWVVEGSNPMFVPVQAYTGKISLPGTGIEMDMLAPIEPGRPELNLLAHFEGLSLDNLAHLAGLSGSGQDPFKSLPPEIQAMGDRLGDLQLTHAAVYLEFPSLDDVTLAYLSFTVGMPDLNWAVWKKVIVIDSVYCRFESYYPFHSDTDFLEPPESIVTVYGKLEIESVPFDVYASDQEEFTVNAVMDRGQTIPLATIMKKYAPGIPAPGDLTIDSFKMAIAPNTGYSMALAMASHPHPWVIPVGPHQIMVDDVAIGFTLPQNDGALTGSVSGQIEFGDFATLDVVYDIPGDILIRSLFPEIRFKQIAEALTDQLLHIPRKFDLVFKDSSIMFQKMGSDYVFQLATELEGFGSVGLQVQRVGANWGIACGIDMLGGKPSSMPGTSALAVFENTFTLDKLMLVVSSFAAPQFNFPDLSAIQNPIINAKKISLPSHGAGLTAGFNFYGQWTLNTQDKQHQLLKKFLGLQPTLGITLQVGEIPEENSRFFVDYTTTIQNHPFECQFGAQLQGGEAGIFLTGTFTVNIQKQPQTFDVVLLFVENGAFISADMTGTTAVKFGSLQLADLALEIGIDWEGIPSLGVAATLAVDSFESSIAIFFDSADPAKSLVAGAVSDLTAKDVVDTLVGKAVTSSIDPVLDKISIKGTQQFKIPGSLASDLEHLKFDAVSAAFNIQGGIGIPADVSQLHLITASKGQAWFLTDMTNLRHYQLKKNGDEIDVSLEAQLYCAPENTAIGAVKFPQGFFISAAIAFLGFHADATIEININRGIAIDADMDQVVIGNANLFALTAEKGGGGPKVSASTFNQPKHPVKEFRPPHFYINGSLTMLGLTDAVFIELTTKGFEFDLKGNLMPGMAFDLNGMFAGPQHLSIGGSVKVGLGTIDLGPIGKLRLDTDADAALSISVHGDMIEAKVQADFEALGKKHHIASFDLDISKKAIANLAKTLEKKAEQAVTSTAKDLLKDVENAQKKVDDLNGQISRMRKQVEAEHDESVRKFNAAKDKVDAAQKKVDSLNKQISDANKQINSLKAAIASKKSWAGHGNVFQRVKRGAEYTAFAAAKGTEITGLYAEIGTLTSAEKAADAALTVAKQPLIGLKKAAQVVPVDADPRVAALIAAKATASAALTAAKAPLKGLA